MVLKYKAWALLTEGSKVYDRVTLMNDLRDY